MQHEKCATVAVGSGSPLGTVALPPGPRLCNLPTLHLVPTLRCSPNRPPAPCQDTVDPFGEFTGKKSRRSLAAKFIRLEFAAKTICLNEKCTPR